MIDVIGLLPLSSHFLGIYSRYLSALLVAMNYVMICLPLRAKFRRIKEPFDTLELMLYRRYDFTAHFFSP